MPKVWGIHQTWWERYERQGLLPHLLEQQKGYKKMSKMLQEKMREEEKQLLSDEIINICNANKGNIYFDKYQLADMIKETFKLYDIE